MINVHGVIEAVGTDKRVTGACTRWTRWTRPDSPVQERCGSGKQLGFPGPIHMLPVVLSGAVFHPQVLGEDRRVCRVQACHGGGSPEP